jgi:type VI secretion system secreted protein Hcp
VPLAIDHVRTRGPGVQCPLPPAAEVVMAIDIFAKIGDIKGESSDDKHKEEIEVLSYSWGVKATVIHELGGGGAVAGKPTFQDLSITHHIDKATPRLFGACATGVHFKDAIITHRKAGKGQHEYLVIKMNDVIVTGVAHSSDKESTAEVVTMSFAKVNVEYQPLKADGTPDASLIFKYDIQGNKVG